MITGKVRSIFRGDASEWSVNDTEISELIVQVGLTSVKVYYKGKCEVGEEITFSEDNVYSATLKGFYDLQILLESFGAFHESEVRETTDGWGVDLTKNWKYVFDEGVDPEHKAFINSIIVEFPNCINVNFVADTANFSIPSPLHMHGTEALYKIAMTHERLRWKVRHEKNATKGEKFNPKNPETKPKRVEGLKKPKAKKINMLRAMLRDTGNYPINSFKSQSALAEHIENNHAMYSHLFVKKRTIETYLKEIFEEK